MVYSEVKEAHKRVNLRQLVYKSKEGLIIDRRERNWKMNLIRERVQDLSEGETLNRRELAIEIKTDERNTHIMVKKMQRNEELKDLVYNRETRSYSLA
jgi:hypothetical protein